jgi:O-antigen/teichoic acid export membrane protein
VLVGATVFSTFVSFVGSVYFVEKKSLLSMFTALTGAIINVILNFILIPDHGAMGAAVATLISYVAVYVVRVIDTKKYIRFNTHTLLLLINCALIFMQAAVIYSGVRHHMVIELGFILVIALVNAKGIFSTVKEFFGLFLSVFKKRKS